MNSATASPDYDTIVLGLGAMGSAALYQLAKRGNKVLGIEQFNSPHHFGSSHGDTRITRQAIGEGEEYVPLVLRAYDIFREIEKETGRQLLTVTGGLILSSKTAKSFCHVDEFFPRTLNAAKKFNIEHEVLTAEEIRERFPQFKVPDNEEGYYEHNAGFLRPEECVTAQLELAQKYGAELYSNEKVLKYESNSKDLVTVTTDKGQYTAKKLIISAGAWLPELIGENYGKHFKITRQVLYWFDVKESPESYLPGKFPVFVWQLADTPQGIYGFPALDVNGGVKIATEQSEITTKADELDRNVTPEETQEFYKTCIAPNFPGITGKCIKSAACLYTSTADYGFVIDKHPDDENIIVASPCSGHGFKHSAAIGEVLAELVVDGKSKIDISKFSFNRLLQQNKK